MAVRTPEEREMVRDRRVNRLIRASVGRGVITIFLCWHLLSLFIWNMSDTQTTGSSDLVHGMMNSGVQSYMTSTGFMQGWTMFSPEPFRLDIAVEARIHHADGTVDSWYFPQMAKLSYVARYNKERWRKYIEIAEGDTHSAILWQPMAAYAVRAAQKPGESPATSVDLYRHWRIIPPPGQAPGPMNVFKMDTFVLTSKGWR